MLRRISLIGDASGHGLLRGAALGFIIAGFSRPAMTAGCFVAALFLSACGSSPCDGGACRRLGRKLSY
ncbi:metal ABC transporter permease [Variovorax paradoxus]|uniref:metal ABC transporter permease n=1 Tax=Variovorax paradoxus TaxID=34073 RepID=UPI003869A0D9